MEYKGFFKNQIASEADDILVLDTVVKHTYPRVRIMVLNGTLNNISVISWQSVLLVEK